MRRILQIAAGIPAMLGVYLFLRHMIYGISADFGDGFFVGVALTMTVGYVAWRVSPESFQGDDPLRK